MKEKLIKRFIFTCLGTVLIGIGISYMRLANLGTDPFSCIVVGMAGAIGTRFWYVQMFLLAALLIVVIIFDKQLIGIGTLINLVFIGFISDVALDFMEPIINITSIYMKLFILIIGILLICIGASLYMNAELGISSYDALGIIIEKQSNNKIKYRYNRIATDFICVLVGYVLGSTIGIGTVIMAFFTGPMVSFFRKIWRI